MRKENSSLVKAISVLITTFAGMTQSNLYPHSREFPLALLPRLL